MGFGGFAYNLKFQLERALRDWKQSFEIWKKNKNANKIFRNADPYPRSASISTFSISIPWSEVTYAADWIKSNAKLLLLLSLSLPAIGLVFWISQNIPSSLNMNSLSSLPEPELPVTAPLDTSANIKTADSSGEKTVEKAEEKKSEILNIPNNMKFLLASKKSGKMFLYSFKNKKWELLKEWPMLYGANEGDKWEEGDKKTPEGNYWVTQIYPGPRVGELYGSLIFTLDFPNTKDLAEGKTGDGIWIHGNPFGKPMERTKGCLKLSNAHMLELFPYVYAGTPVAILSNTDKRERPSELSLNWVEENYQERKKVEAQPYNANSKLLSRDEILAIAKRFVNSEEKLFAFRENHKLEQEEVDKILARIEKWKADWSSKNIESYRNNYHPDFKGRNGRTLNEFVQRKKLIVNNLDSLTVKVSNVQIIPQTENSLKAEFNQSYRAYRGGEITLAADSEKELIFYRKDGKWLIAKE